MALRVTWIFLSSAVLLDHVAAVAVPGWRDYNLFKSPDELAPASCSHYWTAHSTSDWTRIFPNVEPGDLPGRARFYLPWYGGDDFCSKRFQWAINEVCKPSIYGLVLVTGPELVEPRPEQRPQPTKYCMMTFDFLSKVDEIADKSSGPQGVQYKPDIDCLRHTINCERLGKQQLIKPCVSSVSICPTQLLFK